VALILPPGHTRISQWEYVLSGLLACAVHIGTARFREIAGKRKVFRGHARKDHARAPALLFMGPGSRSGPETKGIGTALLEPVLAKADAEKKPFYLETHNEKNVDYYKRFGFGLPARTACPNTTCPYGVWYASRIRGMKQYLRKKAKVLF
jgi:hypothetical protein